MNKLNGFVALAVVGLALVAAAYVWPVVAPVRGDWGEQQARQYTEAAQMLAPIAVRRPRRPRHPIDGTCWESDAAALAAAEQEYQRQRKALDRARQWRSRPATWLKWTGAALALSGALGYLVLRQRAESESSSAHHGR